MTEQEMVTLFTERYNLSSNSNDDKLDEEVYLLLNSAVERFVRTRFDGTNPRGESFEITPRAMDDLRTLITKTAELSQVSVITEIPNGRRFAMPADFWFLIKAFYRHDNNWYSCERITNEISYKWIETPQNKPIIREGKILYDSATAFIILVDPDKFSLFDKAILQYLKKPAVIASGVDCDLPEHTHDEVVEIAVGLAIDEIENTTRLQSHSEKLKRIE